jgi:hypothetical protein
MAISRSACPQASVVRADVEQPAHVDRLARRDA